MWIVKYMGNERITRKEDFSRLSGEVTCWSLILLWHRWVTLGTSFINSVPQSPPFAVLQKLCVHLLHCPSAQFSAWVLPRICVKWSLQHSRNRMSSGNQAIGSPDVLTFGSKGRSRCSLVVKGRKLWWFPSLLGSVRDPGRSPRCLSALGGSLRGDVCWQLLLEVNICC